MNSHQQPFVKMELWFAMLLPRRYHWLILLFHQFAENIWSFVPLFIVLFVFSRYIGYLLYRNIEDRVIRALRRHGHLVTQIGATQGYTSYPAAHKIEGGCSDLFRSVEGDVSAAKSKHSTVPATDDKIEDIELALPELASVPTQIDALKDRIETLESAASTSSSVHKQTETLQVSLREATDRSKSYENSIPDLRAQAAKSTWDIGTIKRTAKRTAEAIEDLQARFKGAEDAIDSLESKVDLHERDLKTDYKDIKENKEAIEKIDSKLESESNALDGIFTRVKRCEDKVTVLQSGGSSASAAGANGSAANLALANESAFEGLLGPSSTPATDDWAGADASSAALSSGFDRIASTRALQAPLSCGVLPSQQEATTSHASNAAPDTTGFHTEDETMDDWESYDETMLPESLEAKEFMAVAGDERSQSDEE